MAQRADDTWTGTPRKASTSTRGCNRGDSGAGKSAVAGSHGDLPSATRRRIGGLARAVAADRMTHEEAVQLALEESR